MNFGLMLNALSVNANVAGLSTEDHANASLQTSKYPHKLCKAPKTNPKDQGTTTCLKVISGTHIGGSA